MAAIEYSVGKIPTNSNAHVQFDQVFDALHKTGLLKQASFSVTEFNQVVNFLIPKIRAVKMTRCKSLNDTKKKEFVYI
jgi:hypothetical protein